MLRVPHYGLTALCSRPSRPCLGLLHQLGVADIYTSLSPYFLRISSVCVW